MTEHSTTGDLLAAGEITDDAVTAVVYAFVTDPREGLFDLGSDYQLNVAEAIDESPLVCEILRRADASDDMKQAAVRTAVLQGTPMKA